MFAAYPSIASKVFSFNIELLNKEDIEKQKGADKRLALTVLTLIKDFLSAKTNAVVYVCDNIDERHAIRFKNFTNWFDNLEDGDYIQVIEFVSAMGQNITTLFWYTKTIGKKTHSLEPSKN